MAETQIAKGFKNEKIGEVVSTKMQKTIVVEVSRRVPHPLYKRIIECRPLSKLKRWRLADVIRRAPQVGVQPSELDVKV